MMVPMMDIFHILLFLLAVVARSCHSSLEIGHGGNIVTYNPQRIMKQFGFDQGSVMIASETSFSSIRDPESRFLNYGLNKIPLILKHSSSLTALEE